jgi:hypothetical protein
LRRIIFLIWFLGSTMTISCATTEKKDWVLETTGVKEVDARKFYNQMKDAILTNKKDTLASLIWFPVGADIHGHHVVIKNKAEFLEHYDEIINQHIKEIVRAFKFDGISPTYHGFFVNDGEIIFEGVGDLKHNVVLISGFNNEMKN